MTWYSELSDNHQSLIDIRSEEYDSRINYVVARSTSGGDYPAVCLPCYLVFRVPHSQAMAREPLRMRQQTESVKAVKVFQFNRQNMQKRRWKEQLSDLQDKRIHQPYVCGYTAERGRVHAHGERQSDPRGSLSHHL
jgi:hypothetical protein